MATEVEFQRLLPDSSIRNLVRTIRKQGTRNAPVKLLEQCAHVDEAAKLLEEIRSEPVPAWRIALNKRRSRLDSASESPTCPRLQQAREVLERFG